MLDVVCCTRRTTVLEGAHLMRRRHVGDLVVVEDDEVEKEPIGVITDRDIVVEVLAKGLDPATTLVGSDDMLRRLTADAGLLTDIISRQQSLEERRLR
jgi:CBS domain-containing protein